MAPDSNDEEGESPAALEPDDEKVKSPAATVSSAVPNEESVTNEPEDLKI